MKDPSFKQPATVIISQLVPEAQRDAFERCQNELTERVKHFDGFIGNEVIPPKPGVQEEWVVIFRFDTPSNLNDWLKSRQRSEIVDQFPGILSAPPRMQIIAEEPKEQAVTAVFSHHIKPGCENDYREWRRKIYETQERFVGFMGQESFDPVEGLNREWVDIARFDSSKTLDRWLASTDRKRLLKELQPLLEDMHINRLGTGLDGWFRTDNKANLVEAPPAWKQAISVWFGLYPTVMLLTLYFNPLLGKTPFSLVMLIANAVSVALLTWLVMPLVNRLLGFWLLPKKPSVALDAGVTAAIVAFQFGLYLVFHAIHQGG
ncbi:MAG: antibiotic biosynthesis monooxygenase [Puniceicoccales bacterium]